jgi:hypothetical protein
VTRKDRQRRRDRDGCVVDSAPLAAMIASFVARWGRESTGGRFTAAGAKTVSNVGAIAWLVSESGVAQNTIQNVAACRYRTVELRTADALVTALGQPEAFHDGTLTVRPNPIASREARASCCAGATTRAASPRAQARQ